MNYNTHMKRKPKPNNKRQHKECQGKGALSSVAPERLRPSPRPQTSYTSAQQLKEGLAGRPTT
jgi:hypothetical protein